MTTPGPAMRTASELPRKSPVPIAPPIAIILSWPAVSWRDSCSPFSMAPAAASAIFVGFARTTRRIECAQEFDGGGARILHAMAHAYGKVNAAARFEFARCVIGMHNAVTLQDENHFFISVEVNQSLTLRNPSRELGNLPAAEVPIDQIAKQTVLAGADVLAMVFMHQQLWRFAGIRCRQSIHNVALGILGATGADNTQSLRAGIIDVVGRAGRNENRGPGTEWVTKSIDEAFSLAADHVEHFFGVRIHYGG